VRATADANEALTQNLTLEKIHKGIQALPKGKAPVHDGIPIEFFQVCASEVAPTLLKAYTAILASGKASKYINRGLITLIPKTGDRSKLRNWRPITLLGSVYKILAKTLAGRLQAFLPGVIKPNQTGFVEGRSILDNVFIAQDSLDWVVESDYELVLLLLDFEKAFDRIEWNFLFTALSKLGFNSTWVRWVCTLYLHATSVIIINGEAEPVFQLAQSICQGCPLTPYLFILATDVLGHMLKDPRYDVEGLNLPRGGRLKDETFVDDTAL
jgi:mannosylglycoprotein endo-beta-mannosidase